MDQLLFGLFIALGMISAFVAYRWPNAFAVIGKPLAKVVAYGLLFCIVWNIAVDTARQVSFTAVDHHPDLVVKIDAAVTTVIFSTKFIISTVAVLAYLMLLNALPVLREVAKGS